MALIDFDTNILALWTGNVDGEEPYAQGAIDFPARYNDDSEQRTLVMMDIMRAYLETLTRRDELQRFHMSMSRILGEVAYNRIYDNLNIDVSGNVPVNGSLAVVDTIGLTTTEPDGTVTTVAPAAVGATATLALLVAAINGLGAPFGAGPGAGVYVEAYISGNNLGFRTSTALTAGQLTASQALTFEFTGTLVAKSGLRPGPYVNAVRATARNARDKGLDHFHKEIRNNAQP